jgi:hypothetical protein
MTQRNDPMQTLLAYSPLLAGLTVLVWLLVDFFRWLHLRQLQEPKPPGLIHPEDLR